MVVKIGLVGYQSDAQGWELGEALDCFLQPNEILPTAPWLHLRVVASLNTLPSLKMEQIMAKTIWSDFCII